MKDVETEKCPHCGFENVKGTLYCGKCHMSLKAYVSCPKCAKRNPLGSTKCIGCGYNLNKKKNGLFKNLIISAILVVALCLIVYLSKVDSLKNMRIILNILVVVLIIVIFCHTISYGTKDINKFEAHEEVLDTKKFNKMRIISSISVIVGITVALALVIYFLYFK